MSQMVGSSTYWLRIMLSSGSVTFKSGACYYFCSPDKSFHCLFSCAESWEWVRTDFSHDLFTVCEECVALACNNGITAGLKLEVPFLSAFCLMDSTSSLHRGVVLSVVRCLFARGYFRSLGRFNLLCVNKGVTGSCAVWKVSLLPSCFVVLKVLFFS